MLFFISLVLGTDLWQFIQGDGRIWLQIAIGCVFGVITAKAGWQIVELPQLAKIRQFFAGIIRPLQLNTARHHVMISLCAGIGEELFFRGAVQPLLGVLDYGHIVLFYCMDILTLSICR